MSKKTRLCAFLIVFVVAPFASADGPSSVDVTYPNGEIKLAAELMLPEGASPFPAVVIIQGSGDSDRTNNWARAISDLLTKRGMAVLLTDKRGSGRSGGHWQTSSFEDLASDALAGVAFLQSRPDIDRARVGLAGLSQGGWIAPIAAARSSEAAFVIVLSGAAVSFVEQTVVEIANTARQAGLSDADVAAITALHVAAGRYLVSGDWQPYGDARARTMNTPAKPVAEGFPGSPSAPQWTFLRKVGTYDPLPYWSLVAQPVFFAFGEEDEKDNVPVGESVRRLQWVFEKTAKKNYEIVVAPGVGHGLYSGKFDFAPVTLQRLDAWLDRNVTSHAH